MNDESRLLDHAGRALRAGQPQRAVQLLRELLTRDPHHAFAHALLAMCLHDERRLEAALYEAKLALTIEPELGFAHYALGHIYTSRRAFRLAREHLELARANEPDDAHIALAFARLYGHQGKRNDELVELERARAHAPDDPDVLAALGEGYMERRRYAEAEEMATSALHQEPEHANSLVLRGHLHLKRGELGSASDHALWVLSSDATHHGALLLLTAIKARSSIWLGLWWRYHSFLTSMGEARSTLVLVSAFALYRVGLVALAQHGKSEAQGTLMLFWLAVCAYTWVGPSLFKRALEKELATVRLRDDF